MTQTNEAIYRLYHELRQEHGATRAVVLMDRVFGVRWDRLVHILMEASDDTSAPYAR